MVDADARLRRLFLLPAISGGGAVLLLGNARNLGPSSVFLFALLGAAVTVILGTVTLAADEGASPNPERRWWYRGHATTLLVLSLLFWLAPVVENALARQTPAEPQNPGAQQAGDHGTPPGKESGKLPALGDTVTVPAVARIADSSRMLVGIVLAAVALPMLVVGLACLATRNASASRRAVGSVAIAASLLSGGQSFALLKDTKLDLSLKPDVHLGLGLGSSALNVGDGVRVGTFLPGWETTSDPSAQSAVDQLKSSLLIDLKNKEHVLVLVVGSVDRRPLGRNERAILGSNMGLARARAESVERELKDAIDYDNLLASHSPVPEFQVLVVGPKGTSPHTSADDMAHDRAVYVRIISDGNANE
jgi:hypothetical protein